MARSKKDPFADLSEEFKNMAVSLSSDELKRLVAKVAIEQVELAEAKKADQDLEDKRAAYWDAGSVYREQGKEKKLMIAYMKQVLSDKGQV